MSDWIKCKDRPPKSMDGRCLITVKFAKRCFWVDAATYFGEDSLDILGPGDWEPGWYQWKCDVGWVPINDVYKVVAWMPFPDPYKEDADD